MFTMALAARALDTWAGGHRAGSASSAASSPSRWWCPTTTIGVEVTVRGTVKNATDEGVQIALEVTCGDQKVLGMPKAVLRG